MLVGGVRSAPGTFGKLTERGLVSDVFAEDVAGADGGELGETFHKTLRLCALPYARSSD